MTPQERELITSLMGRLKKVGGEPKDHEAEALIRQSMSRNSRMRLISLSRPCLSRIWR